MRNAGLRMKTFWPLRSTVVSWFVIYLSVCPMSACLPVCLCPMSAYLPVFFLSVRCLLSSILARPRSAYLHACLSVRCLLTSMLVCPSDVCLCPCLSVRPMSACLSVRCLLTSMLVLPSDVFLPTCLFVRPMSAYMQACSSVRCLLTSMLVRPSDVYLPPCLSDCPMFAYHHARLSDVRLPPCLSSRCLPTSFACLSVCAMYISSSCSITSGHNHHSDYFASVDHAFSACFHVTGRWAFSYGKVDTGSLTCTTDDLNECCAQEGKRDIDECAQMLTRKFWKTVLHPTSSRSHP